MKIITIIAIVFGFVVLCGPIIISELIGGWTKKYTSKVRFSPSSINLKDKVAIVTGGNTGIGYETALSLAKSGAHVIVAARSESKGEDAVRRIQVDLYDNGDDNSSSATVQFIKLDLASLASVKSFAESFKKLNLPLHILVLNAGVMKSPGAVFVGQELRYGFETTNDGFEYHIGVNHIAHAYLTDLLLDQLKKSAPSRIISTSSMAEQGAYEDGMVFETWVPKDGIMPDNYEDGVAYAQSKLANLMYANELSKRLNGTGVTAYACHPGIIATELSRYLDPVIDEDLRKKGILIQLFSQLPISIFRQSFFDSKGGALTQLHLAMADEPTLINGANYHPVGRVVNPLHPQGSNETLRELLWSETRKAIKKRSNYKYER